MCKNNPEQLKQLNIGDGQLEYDYLLGKRSLQTIGTKGLNQAVDDYYINKKDAVDQMEEFFKKHYALEAERPFLNHLLQKIEFREDRLIGLSILLMRDGTEVESVKFGMLLTKYYDISSVPRALEILKNLCLHPAFVYYGLDILKNIDYGIIDEIHEKSYGLGKKIIEEKIWK
ncbi:MAG: hypothetical protein Q4P25_04290 [Tissierellia bacterium]|nr:hypothetical protein [Tissierellia bacterium]